MMFYRRKSSYDDLLIKRSMGLLFNGALQRGAVFLGDPSLGELEAKPDEQPSHSDLELNGIACPMTVTLIGELE